jgi:hypothetical protein
MVSLLMTTIEVLRQFRIGGYAIFDFTLSFFGIYLLSPLLSKIFRKLRIDIPKQNWLFLTLSISVFVHLLTGNLTPMTKNFVDYTGHYFLKILIIGLSILGIRGSKIIKKTS